MNCPNCNRLLYSRQRKSCGYCGATLPPEVRFSETEVDAIKAELAAIAARRAKDKVKEEEERKQAAQKNANNYPITPIP